jgi:hypothetical protein
MMFDKAVGLVATTSAGITAMTAVQTAADPATYNLGGVMVPVVPVCIAMLSALMVRVIIITKGRKELWSYNVALTALALLGAAVTVSDHKIGAGMAFWVGGGFGACAVLIIEVMKSRFRMLTGIKDEAEDSAKK